jgi:hypothetical protein
MSESFGLGDGTNDLTDTRAMTDAKVTEAARLPRHPTDMGRWPKSATVVRVIVAAVAAIVLGGWLVTLLTAAR